MTVFQKFRILVAMKYINYDSYGKDIGNISGNGTIKDFKFINGLLLVNITNNGKESVKYYTPTGEEVNLF